MGLQVFLSRLKHRSLILDLVIKSIKKVLVVST